MNDNFIEEYKKILNDESRQVEFCKTGIDDDKRVFKILNSNIKTYNTFYKYLKELVDNPNDDHHQKIKRLKDLKIYSENPDTSIKSRMTLALKINDTFEEGSFIRDFMIFAFSLNTNCQIEESSEFIVDLLPKKIFDNYDKYLKQLLISKSIANPIFGLYVFYSDKELLYKYIEYITDLDFNKKSTLETIEDDSLFIQKRIHDMQPGAIANEALIGSMYFKLCTIDLNNINGYNNIVKKIINEYMVWAQQFNLPKKPSLADWEKLERLLLSIDENEKQELLKCFGNVSGSIEHYEPDASKNSVKMVQGFGEGHEGIYTAKYRIGQSKFRKNLIAQFPEVKCRICDCSINKIEFLKASHILAWSKSNEIEKLDPNNGLLLCPIHDFLFDSHLITFDNDGKIIISHNVDSNFYEDFRINNNTKIDILEENIPYLTKHNEEFNRLEEL